MVRTVRKPDARQPFAAPADDGDSADELHLRDDDPAGAPSQRTSRLSLPRFPASQPTAFQSREGPADIMLTQAPASLPLEGPGPGPLSIDTPTRRSLPVVPSDKIEVVDDENEEFEVANPRSSPAKPASQEPEELVQLEDNAEEILGDEILDAGKTREESVEWDESPAKSIDTEKVAEDEREEIKDTLEEPDKQAEEERAIQEILQMAEIQRVIDQYSVEENLKDAPEDEEMGPAQSGAEDLQLPELSTAPELPQTKKQPSLESELGAEREPARENEQERESSQQPARKPSRETSQKPESSEQPKRKKFTAKRTGNPASSKPSESEHEPEPVPEPADSSKPRKKKKKDKKRARDEPEVVETELEQQPEPHPEPEPEPEPESESDPAPRSTRSRSRQASEDPPSPPRRARRGKADSESAEEGEQSRRKKRKGRKGKKLEVDEAIPEDAEGEAAEEKETGAKEAVEMTVEPEAQAGEEAEEERVLETARSGSKVPDSPAKHTRSHGTAEAAEKASPEPEDEEPEEQEEPPARRRSPRKSKRAAEPELEEESEKEAEEEKEQEEEAEEEQVEERPPVFRDEEGRALRFFVRNGPGRNDVVAAIRANGGEISISETTADYRIAPADYDNRAERIILSFAWIHASIAAGKLLDEGRYRIPRRGAHATGRRTEFTKDDDDQLLLWAREGKLGDGKTAGNQVFMRLAELHPRHTWQSWRERWVRNLQPLIGRQIARERKEARDRALAEKAAAGERVEFSDDEEEEVAERKPAPASKRNGGKRVEFSAEDDDILIDTLNQPGMKDTKGNAIFKTIAEQHPYHTWQSWRNRWVKTLYPRLEARGELLANPSNRRAEPSVSIAGSRQKRRRADDADSVTDSDVEPEPPRRRKRNRVPAPLEDLSEDDMEMMGTLDSHALPRRNTAPASAPGPSAGPSGGRKSVGATPTADRRSRPQSAAQSPISQRPAQAPRAQRPPAFDTQFDRQMSEAPAPTNDGEREMDYDFAILSEGDVDDDWNDLVDQDVDLFDHKEFVKNTSPAKPPPGSAGRSNARGPTSSQPQEPRAVSFSQSQSRQQAAGRAAGPSQATENAPGRANAAGPSRRPPPPVRMPSNKEELFALVRKEDERAITAMHMAGGAVDIAIRLYRANLDVSALSTSDRRFVFTHDEDLLIQNYTDVAEIEDILKLHGATKFESRITYLTNKEVQGL